MTSAATPSALRRWLTQPGLIFALVWAAILAVYFAPLFNGGVIVNPMSDGKDGYVTRHFAAETIRLWGEVPRWNPYIFGGIPFLGAMHGDQVYPISVIVRALFAPALAIGLVMVFHLWLGAVGLLTFLRQQRLSWTASIAGATAYGIGGPFIGLFSPGHDGKIYVLGLLPWGLVAILQATRTLRPAYFAAWGAVVGLMLLSPHFQMTYYASMLMAAFVVFCLVTETTPSSRLKVVASMAIASVFALLLAGAQLMPFVEYLPYSPRSVAGSSSTGWAYATSWAMPASELIGALWGGFNGWLLTSYWGTNAFKLHSDYLGLLTGVLALTALLTTPKGAEQKRVWFWLGAVVFGTLWVLAAQTPFYRLPYTFLPAIAKTRAPSMMWGHVSLCVAVLAAVGVANIEAMTADARRKWGTRVAIASAIGGVILFAASGDLIPNLAVAGRQDAAFLAVQDARFGITLGAATVILFAIAAIKVPRWVGLAGAMLLLTDLGIQGRRFVMIDPKGDAFFAADAGVQAMQGDSKGLTQPWRVLAYSPISGRAYSDDYLIEHRIRAVLGYHGNEIHHYDDLLGGKNQWTHLANQRTWRLLAVRYLVTAGPIDAPGFVPVASGITNWLGDSAWIWRVPAPAPWARVVPVALKVANEKQLQELVISHPDFDPDRIALVDTSASFGSVTPPPTIPEPLTPPPIIKVTERQPGVYVLAIEGLTSDGVLLVSENWMPTWTAHVDGREAPVARANGTFIAVPLGAHAKEVVLSIEPRGDRNGLKTSLAGFAGLGLFALSGLFIRRRSPATTASA